MRDLRFWFATPPEGVVSLSRPCSGRQGRAWSGRIAAASSWAVLDRIRAARAFVLDALTASPSVQAVNVTTPTSLPREA